MRRALGRSARAVGQSFAARPMWRATIVLAAARVVLLSLVVVVAADSQRETTRPAQGLAQAATTPHSLPTVPPEARSSADISPTPTPRVIRVAEPTQAAPASAMASDLAPAPVDIPAEAQRLEPAVSTVAAPAPLAVDTLPVLEPQAPTAWGPHTFTAANWTGGFYRGDRLAYGRPWVAVYGADSAYPRASLSFTLDAAPVGEATLGLTGLDDEWAALNEIALEVNGQVIFTGPSPFANWDGVGDGTNAAWTTVPFRIPAGTLRPGANGIVLSNRTPAANFNSPPYVLLADATLEVSLNGGDGPLSHSLNAQPAAVAPVAVGAAAVIPAAAWDEAFSPREPLHFGRPWVAIYGDQTVYSRATVTILLDTRPATMATLTLSGIDDEWLDRTPMAVEVNGKQIFNGPSPFADWDGTATGGAEAWTPVAISIAPELLQAGRNTITVANLAPTVTIGSPPYVLLGDASLQAPGTTVTVLEPGEESP